MGTPGQLVSADTLSFRAFAVCWLPDGRLAVGGISGSDFNHGALTVLPAEPGPAGWTRTDIDPVDDIAASPDGQWLAVAGWQSGVVSTADGTPRFPALGQFRGHAVGFSPNGSLVAWNASVFENGEAHGSIKVVDAVTGTIRRDIPREGFLRWAFSADSRRIAIVDSSALDVVDVNTGEAVRLSLASAPFDVAYSPDGRWLAAACEDGAVRIFDAATSQPARTVAVHETSVHHVTFSPDGQWFAASALGVGVFGAADGKPRLPFADALGSEWVVFSPDLRYFAVRRTIGDSSEPGLAVLDAATGALVWQAAVTDDFAADLEFSPDGRRIALGSTNSHETGAVHVYDSGVDVSRHQHDAEIIALAMSPAGTPLVAFADDAPAVTVLAAESGARLARKPVPGTLADVVFADGGQSVAVAGSAGVRLFAILGDRSWKADTIGTVNAVAVGGAAGEWIAVASGRSARVLGTGDGRERWGSPNAHPQTVTRVAMSADGRWVATGCTDRRTRILDATTGTEVLDTDSDGKVFDLAFGPLATLLATANEDGSVVIVDTATMAVRARITRTFACSLLAFNHDETLLATAWEDSTVSIHDLTAGETPPELLRLNQPGPVTTLAFDPAGRALCVATGSPTVRLFDPRSGLEILRVPQLKPVRHIAFSADGTLIATASDDAVVRVVSSVDNRPG
jgi:WD40 repeat protein